MTVSTRARTQRLLREAEGYLELGLSQHALDVLDRVGPPGTFKGHWLYLRGESLRAQEQFMPAIDALETAADLLPSRIEVFVALGWCYKREGRLDQAIDSLNRALDVEPGEPLLLYNLACYWSLAGNKAEALSFLARAITKAPEYRTLIDKEADFDPLRADPDFQALTAAPV